MSPINPDDLKSIKISEPTPPAYVSEKESDALVADLASEAGVTEDQAALALCIICQKGGTARKAQGTIYAIVDGKKIDLNQVRKVMKDKHKFTLRQWARTNATTIYEICSYFGIPGDLSKRIVRNKPQISQDELYWLSNFQMDNPNCPQNIRDALME